MAKDYYEVLGIGRNASDKEIRQAYRRLARRHHPDVNPGDKSAESRFKEINQAYEVLSDPEKRRKYDQYGDQWQFADQFAKAGAQGAPEWEFTSAGPGGFDFGGFATGTDMGDIFESLLKGSGARGAPRRSRRRQDAEYPLEVTLEEAFQGTKRTIQTQSEEPCSVCGGKGALQNAPCYSCRGTGTVLRPRTLEAKIPPGVNNGSRVRIAGAGGAGYGTRERGDLYLVISIKPHSLFERKGDDLHLDLSVPLTTAILGGEVEVPILKGKVVLKIPPETQNGKAFRLAGQGMPHLGDTSRGDLFAKVKVVLPQNLSHKEKELFAQLRALRPT